MKKLNRWFPDRLQDEITAVRRGTFGTPVLVLPTAGGDAEEIERNGLVHSCDHVLTGGRVKLYHRPASALNDPVPVEYSIERLTCHCYEQA